MRHPRPHRRSRVARELWEQVCVHLLTHRVCTTREADEQVPPEVVAPLPTGSPTEELQGGGGPVPAAGVAPQGPCCQGLPPAVLPGGGGCGLRGGGDTRGGRRAWRGCLRLGGPHDFWLMRRVPAVSAWCRGPRGGTAGRAGSWAVRALLPWGTLASTRLSSTPRPASCHGRHSRTSAGEGGLASGSAGPPSPHRCLQLAGPCGCLSHSLRALLGPLACWASQDPGWAVFPASRRCSKVLVGLPAATGPLS
ncbi:uncharacterized protein LOC125098586 isoform X2 [Lutra lutra]|nr:uncharacterized protein LOC125098586 isoform X2 [Lutra lutra]XP_047583503.1 uncharacterized protein LOC125098586 isoform X2 [Lutra lutra]XP_047583504.1 uncharacterized protein LOC125098586 isoform X2 [Lutra lutra]XP_047583506.1 uncharacterized protein LOC125098586 isoform X2 [Lutra lutra]